MNLLSDLKQNLGGGVCWGKLGETKKKKKKKTTKKNKKKTEYSGLAFPSMLATHLVHMWLTIFIDKCYRKIIVIKSLRIVELENSVPLLVSF